MVETSPPPDGAHPVALPEESKREPRRLRSARWYDTSDMRGFAHRQRTQQMGLRRAETVKRGVLLAGGYPVELPALCVGEVMVKPTTMLYRNFLAMETEELLRSHPIDGAVLLGGCDKSVPGSTRHMWARLPRGVTLIF
jgi:Dehydratase family